MTDKDKAARDLDKGEDADPPFRPPLEPVYDTLGHLIGYRLPETRDGEARLID